MRPNVVKGERHTIGARTLILPEARGAKIALDRAKQGTCTHTTYMNIVKILYFVLVGPIWVLHKLRDLTPKILKT